MTQSPNSDASSSPHCSHEMSRYGWFTSDLTPLMVINLDLGQLRAIVNACPPNALMSQSTGNQCLVIIAQ